MKLHILALTALLATGYVTVSCGGDDDVTAIAEQHTTYVGSLQSKIKMNGLDVDCGIVTATATATVGKNGKATVTLKPFTATVAPYNNMTIETQQDLVVKDMAIRIDDGHKEVTGTFEQMMPTVMNGSTTELPVKGNFEGEFTDNTLEFDIEFTQWGSMPFSLVFDYHGAKQQ